MLRNDLRPRHGRDPLWRRAVLTRREDLRVGAAVCGGAATCGGLALSLLGDAPTVPAAVTAILGGAAVVSSVWSLRPDTDRQLVVYRETHRGSGS